jgi:glycine cleavage system H protein
MASPNDRLYTRTHEWVKIEGASALVGISGHAQEALGDITFVELPKVGSKVTKGKEYGVIESVKAASDIYAPISGEVAAVNGTVAEKPEIINSSPYDQGWLVKLSAIDAAEANDLLDAAAYEEFLKSEG